MATLIKRPNSPFWIACFDVPQPDGSTRRLKQSTKRAKKSEALTEALRLESAATKAGSSTSDTAGKAFAILTEAAAAAARCQDWQGMILLGFYAGARLGDCARLTWEAVDLDRKTLSFMPAKTERKRKRLEVPLHPRLVTWIQGRDAGAPDAPLFPVMFQNRVGGSQGLSAQFAAIMATGKIDRKTTRQAQAGRRAQHARSFHALRHSLTSTLANLDVSEEIRRRIVGHESAEVHAGYTHTERETLARAMAKMPSLP